MVAHIYSLHTWLRRFEGAHKDHILHIIPAASAQGIYIIQWIWNCQEENKMAEYYDIHAHFIEKYDSSFVLLLSLWDNYKTCFFQNIASRHSPKISMFLGSSSVFQLQLGYSIKIGSKVLSLIAFYFFACWDCWRIIFSIYKSHIKNMNMQFHVLPPGIHFKKYPRKCCVHTIFHDSKWPFAKKWKFSVFKKWKIYIKKVNWKW